MNSIIFLGFFVITAIMAQNATVDLPNYGTLIGSTNLTASGRPIYQFLGIKFAESPTGPRRFKAPVSVLPSVNTAPHNVQNHCRPCPTIEMLMNMTDSSIDVEDCLHVSVYSTNLTAKSPVMVYIHGGGFYEGAAAHHPPHYLLEKDVVLVVPQYRLGPLGFLSTQTADIPGNAGVLDILKALEWTQTNIVRFGGDPDRVTLFGQSAGAGLIGALLLSPALPPHIFHKVILQSGSALNSWAFDYNPAANARDIAARAGCATDTIDTINQCFMNMGVLRMLQAFWSHAANQDPRIPAGGFRMSFGPTSSILPRAPEFLIENIARKNIPILGGVTKNDGSFILATAYDSMVAQGLLNRTTTFLEIFNQFKNDQSIKDESGTLSAFIMQKLFTKEQILAGNFTKMIDGLVDLCTNVGFKGPILQTLQANLNSTAPTYLYTFDYTGEHTRFGYGANTSHYPFHGGVHHSNDNIYIFPWPENVKVLNERDSRFSQQMIDLWTSFANNSIPTSANCGQWPEFTTPIGPYLHLNAQCSQVGDNFLDEFDVAVREKFNSSFGNRLMGDSSIFLIIASLFSFIRNLL